MSCVCAIAQDGKVYMAADTIGVADTYRIYRRDQKIFFNKDYVIGYCGSVRAGQVLESRFFEPPDSINEFPDAMREQYRKKGCITNSETGAERFEALVAIGFKGRCYYVMSDFQLGENLEDFVAIGSGQSYALAVLYHTRNYKNPEFRLKKALEAASYFCVEVGGDPHILCLGK